MDEISLVSTNQDNEFNNHNLTIIKSITLKTEAVDDNHVGTKSYVDQFQNDIECDRRNLEISFYNEEVYLIKNVQDNDFNDNKSPNIQPIAVNRDPSSDTEFTNKKFVYDEIDKNTVLKFNPTLTNYVKVSVGNHTYNLTKYYKMQIAETINIKAPNTVG